MKRRLNILCLLVMLVLGYSVFRSTYYISSAFMDGFHVGMKLNDAKDKEKINAVTSMRTVALLPSNFANLTDSVYNEKSGTFVPALYGKMAVSVNTPFNPWFKFLSMLCSFVDILTMLTAIYIFVKLIIAINKSNIFGWKNVHRLRWLGIILIVNFVSTLIPVGITSNELSGVFAIPGYSLDSAELISSLTLVLGIVSLIVGEIFAIGLRLQEEQELTI